MNMQQSICPNLTLVFLWKFIEKIVGTDFIVSRSFETLFVCSDAKSDNHICDFLFFYIRENRCTKNIAF